MSSKKRTTLYIGVTSDLEERVYQHRSNEGSKFTIKYACHDLVYYEFFADIQSAITREKALKKWNRRSKETLITAFNPQLHDLWDTIEGFN